MFVCVCLCCHSHWIITGLVCVCNVVFILSIVAPFSVLNHSHTQSLVLQPGHSLSTITHKRARCFGWRCLAMFSLGERGGFQPAQLSRPISVRCESYDMTDCVVMFDRSEVYTTHQSSSARARFSSRRGVRVEGARARARGS